LGATAGFALDATIIHQVRKPAYNSHRPRGDTISGMLLGISDEGRTLRKEDWSLCAKVNIYDADLEILETYNNNQEDE